MVHAIDHQAAARPRPPILLVDDDERLLRAMRRSLAHRGYEVEVAANGHEAIQRLEAGEFGCIVSDITMPHMSGIQLLRKIREHDLDVPIVLVTGQPTVDTAVQALRYGALHYLTKPVDIDELESTIERGIRLHRLALMKRQALALGGATPMSGDLAGLEASFDRALDRLWLAYQPIVRSSDRGLHGYEVLLRSSEPSLPHPGAIIEAAERLGRLRELGRAIRKQAAQQMPPADDSVLFVNLHPEDLRDDGLLSPDSPLGAVASRIVLEITERVSLDTVPDARERISALRKLGYRIAIDDLGAGYAGLSSFATLEPEIVKIDMSLVRDVHAQPTKRKLIGSLTSACKDLGMTVVAEGVERIEERDTLAGLGCDLLQGYLLARPGRPFPGFDWVESPAAG
jgi:EAL domain-containing protein (putative c-di-GMP-specific phosphodiesterase class I)